MMKVRSVRTQRVQIVEQHPQPSKGKVHMAQNHYSTKPKRRAKSGKRKDPSAVTMAKLRELAAAETQKSSK